jgi:hypothetical protein
MRRETDLYVRGKKKEEFGNEGFLMPNSQNVRGGYLDLDVQTGLDEMAPNRAFKDDQNIVPNASRSIGGGSAPMSFDYSDMLRDVATKDGGDLSRAPIPSTNRNMAADAFADGDLIFKSYQNTRETGKDNYAFGTQFPPVGDRQSSEMQYNTASLGSIEFDRKLPDIQMDTNDFTVKRQIYFDRFKDLQQNRHSHPNKSSHSY